jgi:hypothetical protein
MDIDRAFAIEGDLTARRVTRQEHEFDLGIASVFAARRAAIDIHDVDLAVATEGDLAPVG